MDWCRATRGITLLTGMLCALVLSGCCSMSVPRIDPTGRRIFAEPMFEPRPITTDVPSRYGLPEKTSVVLTPATLTAQVGSEVVLLAGVVGSDRYLRTNQRIEWSIEEGSGGYFVDVGSKGLTDWFVLDRTMPGIRDATHAIGSTSRSYLRLTRGTPSTADDISVLRGQTWASVSSSREGTSRVSAVSPCVSCWENRKRTAIIHWIDAQWCFPTPSINPAGTRHVFTTTLTRQSTSAPLPGWIVRYEIVEGPPAGFLPDGAQVVEVTSDTEGRAEVEIFQSESEPRPGTNRVAIKIIRPPDARWGERRVVGSGSTLKTWSAPDLAVRIFGPDAVAVGSTANYQIQVLNPGDLPTDEVVLTDTIPPEMSLVAARPRGEIVGRTIRWKIGTLSASDSRAVEVDLRADRPAQNRHCAEARSAAGLSASGCFSTNATEANMDVRIIGPDRAIVGDPVLFEIAVTNRSRIPAWNLTLRDHFDRGLRIEGNQASTFDKPIGSVGAGKTVREGIAFRAVEAGQWCHRVEVLAGDKILASTEPKCVTITDPPPMTPVPPRDTTPPVPNMGGTGAIGTSPPSSPRGRLDLNLNMPASCKVGERVRFTASLFNPTSETISNVAVVIDLDEPLKGEGSRPDANVVADNDSDNRRIRWWLAELAPGKQEDLLVECITLAATPRACVRASASATNAPTTTDEICLAILASPAPTTLSIPGQSGLTMTVDPLDNPVKIGEELTFLIQITNEGQFADTQLALSVFAPEGMRLVSVGADGDGPTVQDGLIRFPETARLDPRQTLHYRVRMRAEQEGKHRVRAELRSHGLPQPVVIIGESEVVRRVP